MYNEWFQNFTPLQERLKHLISLVLSRPDLLDSLPHPLKMTTINLIRKISDPNHTLNAKIHQEVSTMVITSFLLATSMNLNIEDILRSFLQKWATILDTAS